MSHNLGSSTNITDWMKDMDDDFWDETDEQMALQIIENISNPPKKMILQDHEGGADRLFNDYFSPNPRKDAAQRPGLSPLQKCTAAIRMLAYRSPVDILDEYIQIGESMLGSLDCMHWAWKNCPVAWKGQYTRGDHGHPTIMLQAVASVDLWIWHAYFGVAGSNNDLNVLSRSNLFQDELQGRAPKVYFNVNGTTYTMGYYLTDDERQTYSRKFPAADFSQPIDRDDTRQGHTEDFESYLARDVTIRDREKHHQLKADLVEHIWTHFGNQDNM
ncbi:uncharacterized protein LOC104887366 [Beta vulgaris subsp. vulgaris]|uniref:uncharacterized protein LOC104887366 n=1 Tax=Beta vulgaris subsp. vulgaris TaxID=3555 RepID=UPI00053F3BA1|nr:uncharacterized protein LOC104887366 [Beta vulgaris subsp. vulgaris]